MYVCVVIFCLAFFPKAANKLQSCFGEEVGLNISKKFIIDLKWELPAGIVLCVVMLNYIAYFYYFVPGVPCHAPAPLN